MCLVLENKSQEPTEAKKSIICFKVLNGKRSDRGYVYQKFLKQPKVEFGFDSEGNVTRGYHSRTSHSIERKSHLFVIPKGSLYYTGGENTTVYDENYCSNQIIFIGRNNFINRLIAKMFY